MQNRTSMKSQLAAMYAQVAVDEATTTKKETRGRALSEEKARSEKPSNAKRSKSAPHAPVGVNQSAALMLQELFPGDMLHAPEESTGHNKKDEIWYRSDVVTAIRQDDIQTLEKMRKEGRSFDGCNRNGEYLLHLACRRSTLETVKFLVEQCNCDVNVRDEMGRTVLHDACWRPSSDGALVFYLIQHIDPNYLLAKDARGATPFDYVRKEDWRRWKVFFHAQALPPIIQRLHLDAVEASS